MAPSAPAHRSRSGRDDAAGRLDRLLVTGAAGQAAAPAAPLPRERRRALDAVVPGALRGARWSVGASAAVAALVLVCVVALAAAVRTAQAAPGVPVPARAEPSATASPAGPSPSVSPSASKGAAASGPPPGSATAGEVVVHVVGAVAAPGLVRLPAASRVADALEATGGAAPDADLTRVNLARLLVDGEQVVVPRPGDPVAITPVPSTASGGAAGSPAGTPVDLNTATLEQLDALPGIGPVLSQRILDFRGEHGRFTSVAELGEVSGIGDAVLADLEPLVRV